MPILTKSKYLLGLQCPKLLWTVMNDPSAIPEVDEATQYRFDQGHLVGEYAKKRFPSGIQVPEEFRKNIEKTKELLKERKPLFEAGFLVDNIYARADILVPVEDDAWDIIEVKSSTQVKDVNIEDVAFQKHVYTKFGLKIRKCHLMHVDNTYVKQGEIDPKELLKMEDIGVEVEEALKGIQERIKTMIEVMSLPERPDVKIGPHCTDPYACALKDDCWSYLPPDNVFELYYGGKKSWKLFEQGILSIKDIPQDFKLNPKQQIQKQSLISEHTDKENILKFLDRLEHPLYYLDFETFSTAVPLFDGLRPYQQVVFQYSLHVESSDGPLEHHEFLHMDPSDPRPAFLESLKSVLGDSGSIVVFNQSFEIGRLRELSEAFPSYKQWYDELLPRFVDLITPFKQFWWHSNLQHGSNSIKAVLPAVTGKSYSDLEIADGGQASIAYLDMTHGDMNDEEKEKTRKELLKYCGLDTEGMVWIVKELRNC